MEEKKMAWFIEPLSPQTNEVIARRLAELNEIADSASQLMTDDKGKEHSVYRLISHQRVLEFCKSKSKFQLKFKVYTKTSSSAPLKESVIDSEAFKRKKKVKKTIKKAGL
jgi:hypothetical protein